MGWFLSRADGRSEGGEEPDEPVFRLDWKGFWERVGKDSEACRPVMGLGNVKKF